MEKSKVESLIDSIQQMDILTLKIKKQREVMSETRLFLNLSEWEEQEAFYKEQEKLIGMV